jgi:hypothetical protein
MSSRKTRTVEDNDNEESGELGADSKSQTDDDTAIPSVIVPERAKHEREDDVPVQHNTKLEHSHRNELSRRLRLRRKRVDRRSVAPLEVPRLLPRALWLLSAIVGMGGDGWVDVVLGLGARSVDAERRVVLVRVGVRVGFVAVVRVCIPSVTTCRRLDECHSLYAMPSLSRRFVPRRYAPTSAKKMPYTAIMAMAGAQS